MPYALTESRDPANLPMCKEIAEYLCEAYPSYTWSVRIDGGMVIIKNLSIHDQWAMLRKYSDVAHDAGVRKKNIVMAGGEFLEAAHLQRSKKAEAMQATQLEGRLDNKAFKPMRPAPIIMDPSLTEH